MRFFVFIKKGWKRNRLRLLKMNAQIVLIISNPWNSRRNDAHSTL